jgi:plastocyanin
MSGTALDSSASFLGGVDLVQAFVGQRDAGGTLVGTASFALSPTLAPGAWSLTASIPGDITGGRDLVVYGRSSVSGQEAFVSIPIVIAEGGPNFPAPGSSADTFCPSVMPAATPTTPPAAAPTAQPAPPVVPTIAPTPQPMATAAPPAAPTAAPTAAPAPPVAAPAPAPAAVQLSITAPGTPPLSFDTTTLMAAAGSSVTVTFNNNEAGVPHDWHVFNGADSSASTLASTPIITGPGTMASTTFTAPTQTGNYFFWCDVHPTIMTGTFVVN